LLAAAGRDLRACAAPTAAKADAAAPAIDYATLAARRAAAAGLRPGGESLQAGAV